MDQLEVPSPVNFHLMQDALDWESTAMDRPFRIEMFKQFADCFEAGNYRNALELGSGPGFLTEHILNRVSHVSVTLLDFSEAMHDLARARLKGFSENIKFILRDFKDSNWTDGLQKYDCVFSNQAVHELRHKSRALRLHQQVRNVLSKDGAYLICDHFHGHGAMQNDQLYMSQNEQLLSLQQAGFNTDVLLTMGSLQLVRAT